MAPRAAPARAAARRPGRAGPPPDRAPDPAGACRGSRVSGARPTHPGRRRGDDDAWPGRYEPRPPTTCRAGAAGLGPPDRCSASRPDRKGATRGTPCPRSRSASYVAARRACSRCRAVARPSCPQIRVGSRSVVGGVGKRGSRRGRDRQVTDGQGGEKAEVATRADRVWRRTVLSLPSLLFLTTTTPRGERSCSCSSLPPREKR